MGKPLTEEQRAFLADHITGLPRRVAKKTTSAYVDFLRRRGKVAAELDKLRGSPAYEGIAESLAEAENAASEGFFENAYDGLETVKKIARSSAKGYVDGLTYEAIRGRIAALKDDAQSAMVELDPLWRGYGPIEGQIAQEPAFDAQAVVAVADGDAEARRKVLGAYAVARRDIKLRLEGMEASAKRVADDIEAVGLVARSDVLAKQIAVAKQYGSKKQAQWLGGLDVLLDDARDEARIQGRLVDGAAVRAEAKARGDRVQQALMTRCGPWVRAVQQSEPEQTPALLVDAEKSADRSMVRAKKRLEAEAKRDAALTTLAPKPVISARQLATYKIQGAFDEALQGRLTGLAPPQDDAPPAEPLTEEELEAAAKAATEHVASTLQEQDPTSDVTFDLIQKDQAAFRTQLGRELGWGEAKIWSPEQVRVADRLANAMTKAVRASSPNQMADDKSSVTFDGTTYGTPEVLSNKGAQGIVTRYTASDGSTVVVKSSKTGRKAMAIEMRAHRQAMGGEDGNGHPNLVGMLGGATDADGGLHMLLEECKGGDVGDFASSVREAVASGVLPKQARMALVRGVFAQAAKGLKHVQDSGMTHNDIKGANYFIGEDGTVKIADLGSGRKVDQDGVTIPERANERVPQTDFFRAPEGAESIKSDVFSLGAMLDSLASDTSEGGKKAYFANDERQPKYNVMAFDRLRSAMLDEDPAKRPTLEAVMLASLVDEVGPEDEDDDDEDEEDNDDDDLEEEDDDDDLEDEDEDEEEPRSDPAEASRDLNRLHLAALQKAMTDYSAGPGREIGKLRTKIKGYENDIADINSKKDIWLRNGFFTQERIDEDIRKDEDHIAAAEQQIIDVSNRVNTRQLLDAIRTASEPFEASSARPRGPVVIAPPGAQVADGEPADKAPKPRRKLRKAIRRAGRAQTARYAATETA